MVQRLILMTFLLVFLTNTVQAIPGVPSNMHYQGKLTDINGVPLADGSYTVVFRMWDSLLGGTLLWTETQSVVVTNGVFSVLLGSVTPLDNPPVDFEQHIWLGTEVTPGTGELFPRVQLASTAYSFISKSVESGGAVRSLNGLTDDVTLVPGVGMTVTPFGNDIILSATGGGGGADSDWTVNGNDMYSIPTGNVGVGINTPLHDFHVAGSGINGTQMKLEDVTDPAQQSFQISTFWLETALAKSQIALTTTTSGNKTLQMFAQDPGTRLVLHTEDQMRVDYGTSLQFQLNGNDVADFNDDNELRFWDEEEATVIIRAADPNLSTDGGEILLDNNAGVQTIRLDAYQDGNRGGTIGLYGETGNQGIKLHGQKNASNDGGFAEFFDEDGNRTVQLMGQSGSGTAQDGGHINVYKDNGIRTVSIAAAEDGSLTQGSTIKLYNDNGDLTLELDADHGASNQGRVITDILEITGGSDLSEQFDIHQDHVEPGHVVSIDPDRPGELRLSEAAYDTRVAGVISGAGGVRPGMLMGQRGSVADGAHPVALTGRVYVKADASFGSIEPGDLLTTSDTPGHAMRIGDRQLAGGAILGKAMTSLEMGRGLVLVLVSLQ